MVKSATCRLICTKVVYSDFSGFYESSLHNFTAQCCLTGYSVYCRFNRINFAYSWDITFTVTASILFFQRFNISRGSVIVSSMVLQFHGSRGSKSSWFHIEVPLFQSLIGFIYSEVPWFQRLIVPGGYVVLECQGF